MIISKFSTNKKLLKTKLSVHKKIFDKKSCVKIYKLIKLSIVNNELTLTSINSSIRHTSQLPLESSTGELDLAINTEMFCNIVDKIDGDIVNFESVEDTQILTIFGTKSKNTLKSNDYFVNEFVIPAQNKDNQYCSFEIDTKKFITNTKKSFVCVGDPKTTYQLEFCNVCYTVDAINNTLVTVATDRFRIFRQESIINKLEYNQNNLNIRNEDEINYRLKEIKAQCKSSNIERTDKEILESIIKDNAVYNNFVLPPKTLKILLSAISKTDKLQISFNTDFAYFTFGNDTIILSYGVGRFPNYNKIIPAEFNYKFKINRLDFVDAFNQVSTVSNLDKVNQRTKLNFNLSSNNVKVEAEYTDIDKNHNYSEASFTLDNLGDNKESYQQLFNNSYITDYLSTLDCEFILWEHNTGKLALITPIYDNQNDKESEMYLSGGVK